jgi:peroxiredoxin
MRFFAAFAGLLLPFAALADQHVGRRAPGFALPDLNVNYHDLADYRGKLVLLDFIQTTCPVCQTSQKIFERVRLKYPDKVAVLAIVVPPDTQQTVRSFIANYAVKTPVLFDCGQATASYLKLTPQKPTITFPNLFIIDQTGIIRSHHEYSGADEKYFEQLDPLMAEVDAMLAGKAAGPAAPRKPADPAKK